MEHHLETHQLNVMEFHPQQKELLQAVYDMRNAQKDYFNQSDKYRLNVAKQKERLVDSLLDRYIKAGAVTVKEQPNNSQQSLFQ